jgi:hypothetical protein
MTREELIAAAGNIDRALDDRVEVWRVIFYPDHREPRRIYRGSFTATPGPTTAPPPKERTDVD